MKLLVTVLMYFAVATLVACSLTSCGQATNPILSSSEGYDTLPSWTSLKQEMMEFPSYTRDTSFDDGLSKQHNAILIADETYYYFNEYDEMMTVTSWNKELYTRVINQLDSAHAVITTGQTYVEGSKDTLYRVSWTYPQFIPRVPDL